MKPRVNINPNIYDRPYLILKELRKSIEASIYEELKERDSLEILDLGCGSKPYKPLFKGKIKSYVGLDINKALNADIIGVGEYLPFKSDKFDVIISTQVLEHVDDPKRVIEELYRVIKKEGIIILSTHGIWIKHTSQDNWRWTDSGLEKMFQDFDYKKIVNNGGAFLCLFQIINLYIAFLPIGKRFFWTISNIIGDNLDKWFYIDNYLTINYLVIAKK